MVPKPNADNVIHISILKTLINIFNELNSIAIQKRNLILNQNWKELNELSENQEELNQFLDKTMKSMGKNNSRSDDEQVENLKKILIKNIAEYKNIENLNAKLLKDSLYLSKQKVEKFFNLDTKPETYSMKNKSKSDLWGNKPILHDKMA